MAFARPAARPAARQGHRAPRRADHPRRGPHLRHGRPVPGGQDLRPVRPAVRAGRRRTCCCPTRSRRRARSSRRASPRRARWPASPPPAPPTPPTAADGAVLHLLLDVRLPAGRRPHLGLRRRPGPGLPAAAPPPGAPRCTARASSTRTATACVLASTVPNLAAYDPAFAYELARHRRGRHPPHVRRRARGRLLLPHPLQRELRHAGHARGRRGGHRRGLYRFAPAPEGPAARATILFSGTAQGAAREAQAAAGRAPRRGRRAVERHVVQGPARGRPGRSSAGTACTPPSRRGRPTSPRRWPRPRARSWPSPTS